VNNSANLTQPREFSGKIAVGFANGIGNFIQFIPVLQAISKKYSTHLFFDENLDLPVQPQLIELATHLFTVKRFPSEYRREMYSARFMSSHNNWCVMYDEFVEEREDFDWAASYISEIGFYLDEVYKKFGLSVPSLNIEIPFDEEVHEQYSDRKFICIVNGWLKWKNSQMRRKSYPHWGEVIENLIEFYDGEIFLLGGETDRAWASAISGISPKCKDFTGKYNLIEAFALLKLSELVAGNDTGLMHAANALGKKVVLLFGPTLFSKNGPIGENYKVIISPYHCAPCQGTRRWFLCKEEESCMKAISPHLVFSAIRKSIS